MREIEENDILSAVKSRLERQTKKGLEKYGSTIDAGRFTSLALIEHALEEVTDLLVYLEAVRGRLIGLDKAAEEDLEMAEKMKTRTLTISRYFKHELEEQIKAYKEKGFVLLGQGCKNIDGTSCYARLTYKGVE